MRFNRRTFLRAVGVGSFGTVSVGALSDPSAAATVITLDGGGDDIWGTADAFHYYYETVSGDFDVVVQNTGVENTDSWAKAGLMVRESTDPQAANVLVRRRSNGEASMQYRPSVGADTDSVGGTQADWLRLVRTGDTIKTYHANDRGDWTLIERLGPDDITLPETVPVGLAVTSHATGQLCTATFQKLSGIDPDTSQDIGPVEVAGRVDTQAGVPLVRTGDISSVGTDTATINGDVTDLGAANTAVCRFEYREVPTEEWTTTETHTLDEPGSFSATVTGLSSRRYYEIRATTETSDGDTAVGTTTVFSTEAKGSGRGPPPHAGPNSSSQFGPGDGFAEAAPWLDDSTPVITIREPSRRQLVAALNVDGPRLVVFETSGTVDLEGRDLVVATDNLYLAGQTAPSPGVTLIRGRLTIAANDCVVQHLRVRLGDNGLEEPTEGWALDAINTADGTANNVIDHVSASWSVDEVLSVGYDTTNTTVSNCLIAEALHDSVHPKGSHGYGSLIGNGATNVALLGNVWSQNTDRHPRLKADTDSVVINNLVHNYDDGTWLDPDTTAAIEGNVYLDPRSESANVFAEDDVETAIAHLADNYTNGDVPMVDSNVTQVGERPLWPDGLERVGAGRTITHNLSNAGARPADRTEHDRRIIENIRNGVDSYIDSQTAVGGYPTLAVNTHSVSVPDTATRVWLRAKARDVESGE
ncbi:pectate lyase [Halocatena halophila]|uniref:pectate lyase n=1 Tax=Halocatena halophila TaxID=2814576 RepID=UPI002ED26155